MSSLNCSHGPGRRHAPMSAIRGIKLLLIVILKSSTLVLPEFVEIVDARQGLRDHRPLDRRTDRRLERGRVFKRGRQRGVLWNVAEMCCWLFDSIFACITHCLPMLVFNRI